MELWIRSQDKTMLCKPQYIELQGANEIAMGDINVGYRCVATYETKERALEVLDEIENILKPQQYKIKESYGVFSKSTNISNYVYEMPKE